MVKNGDFEIMDSDQLDYYELVTCTKCLKSKVFFDPAVNEYVKCDRCNGMGHQMLKRVFDTAETSATPATPEITKIPTPRRAIR